MSMSPVKLSKSKSTGGIVSGVKGVCVNKIGIRNISASSPQIARGSATSPNITRHIHCFQNKNNNSSPNKTPTPQLRNFVQQDWTLTLTAEENNIRKPSCANTDIIEEGLLTTTSISSLQRNNSPSSVPKTGQNMAGDIRVVDSKRTRRHWTLRDRSNMSVHFLKANLAEEGCEESQLDVAKKLLQDSRDTELLESAQKENSRLAIYWLVKSSEQGNTEATKLLKECLDCGHGITAQNLPDVTTCINTPTNEKLTYKAARLLYLKLNNGEKFITTTQLLTRIESASKKSVHFAEESESDSNQDSLNSTFTEGDEAGELNFPNVKLNETFTYKRPHSRSQKSSPAEAEAASDDSNKAEILAADLCVRNQEGVKLTLEDLLKCASTFNAGESPRPAINESHKEMGRHNWKFGSQFNAFCFQLLFICAITQAISLNNCVLLAAALLSVWASFNLLRWNKTHWNFADWSKAFGSIQHDHHLWSDEGAEGRLIFNSLMPYLSGLMASTTIFFSLDGLNTLKLVTGCLVSFVLLCSTLSRRLPSFKLIGFLTIMNFPMVLSTCMEYLKDFDLNIQTYISESFIQFMESLNPSHAGGIADVIALKDIVLSIQIIAIIVLLVGNRKTFLQKNLPELLVALWITKILNILSLQLHHNNFAHVGVELLFCVMIIAVIFIIQSQFDYFKIILSFFCVLLIGSVFFTLISTSMEENPIKMTLSSLRLNSNNQKISANGIQNIHDLPLLDWEVYDASCHRKAWKSPSNLSPAFTQLSCFSKYGKTPTAVRWKGKISLVKIREMTRPNFFLSSEDGVSFDIIVNLMMSETDPQSPSSWQQYLPGNSDHHIAADLPSPALVLVSTMQIFGDKTMQQKKTIDFVVNLRTGDKIEFHGILNPSTIGSLRPEIENVQSIRCIECAAFQGKSQDEFFINPHNTKSQSRKSSAKSTSTFSNPRSISNDPINQSVQSLFNQMKQFVKELIQVVKNNSNFMFS